MKQLGYLVWISGSFALLCLSATRVEGQIVPDATLPVNSIVTPDGNTTIINGGTGAGGNLFHSFREFSVPSGGTALFNNGLDIQNIFTRVTGGSISNIDGIIKANGTANLFLINPNGIIFGTNAQLNIGGSFIGSTASSIQFADGNFFSATNLNTPPLLTVNVPVGLQYGETPGNIINRSRAIGTNGQIVGLQVPQGQTLGLIGGNVTLEGGHLRSPQGRIDLGAVGSNSFARLIPNSNNFSVGYEGVGAFQDIQLSQQAVVDTSGIGGGEIAIQGRRVSVRDGSQVLTITQGSQPGGNLTVRGSELVEVTGNNPANFTRLSSDTIGSGAGGNLTVETGQFLLQGTAFLSSSTLGEGPAGNLTLQAFDRAVLVGIGFNALELYIGSAFLGQLLPTTRIGGLFAATAAGGRGGGIAIEAGSLNLLNGAIISAPTFGSASGSNINLRTTHSIEFFGSAIATGAFANSQGSAGNITLTTNQLTVKDSSAISSVTFGSGRAGDIAIAASDFADISDTRPNAFFPTGITNNSFGTGAGGNIRITTGRLFNRGGAIISSNSGGAALRTGIIAFGGPGGNIEIEARESIETSGTVNFTRTGGLNVLTSGFGTTTFTSFPAGDIKIRTPRLLIAEGANISSATLSSGNGGNLTIEASESVELRGRSALDGRPSFLLTSSGRADFPQLVATGNGGNLTINTGELIVGDGAVLDVRSFGTGNAGTLEVRSNSIRVDGGSSLNASTVSGAGGNIVLNSNLIVLRRGSTISTNAGNAAGGNITINTTNLVTIPQENSDISANSLNARGGNVTVNVSGGIFGIQFREQNTPLSDITATGGTPGLSGTVEIRTTINQAENAITSQDNNFANTDVVLATSCIARNRAGNSFTVTGNGGLPSTPYDPLSGRYPLAQVQGLESRGSAPMPAPRAGEQRSAVGVDSTNNHVLTQTISLNPRSPQSQTRIEEAQGFVITADGQTMLVSGGQMRSLMQVEDFICR